ncbi:MAG: hypothetical protein B6I28_06290 [Fusobacteriia bacterium 4572_132]|nr:MAG: hypothetical protein B6I28_06290 [Fusobacteriia bacterium 4572_132]
MSNGKVFYLDDEPELLEFIRFVLERYDYEIITAQKWEEGFLEKLEEVDMIILDLMFPDEKYDGFDICKKLKTNEKLKKKPVYMFSAKTFTEDKEKAFNFGADGYIEKPVKVAKLMEIVENAVRGYRNDIDD